MHRLAAAAILTSVFPIAAFGQLRDPNFGRSLSTSNPRINVDRFRPITGQDPTNATIQSSPTRSGPVYVPGQYIYQRVEPAPLYTQYRQSPVAPPQEGVTYQRQYVPGHFGYRSGNTIRLHGMTIAPSR